MKVKEVVTTFFSTELAFVFYPVIFYPREPDQRWRRHEWAHVHKVREFMRKHGKIKGWLMFYFGYADEVFIQKLPHEERTAEIYAHSVEHDHQKPWKIEYKNCPKRNRFKW